MSVEEMQYNGEVKQENLFSSDGLLTYRRRKRVSGGGESSHAQEDTAFYVDEEAFNSTSRHGNKKDIGWEHGKPIDGNRYHWKCKYCDFVGQSGGVTRLKKHLAGGWHVTTCPKVPKHISEAMNEHLHELKNSKLSKGKKREREVDTGEVDIREEDTIENDIEENEMNIGSPYQESSPDNLERNEPNMQASLDSSFISSQVNGKDFGWEHGKTINGNRYHWKCKWCNFIGRSGGVTRLKKHLAGGWNVTSCTMVPQHIANTMNNHLMELRKKRLFKSRRMDSEGENDTIDDTPLATIPCTENGEADLGVLQLTIGNEERHDKTFKSWHSDNGHRSRQELIADMAKAFNTSQKSKRSARRRSRTGNQRSRDFYRRLNNVAEQTRNFTAKAIKAPHDSSPYTNICEGRYRTTRTHDHWRSVLEHILQLPEIKGADGIESCIEDALIHGNPAKNNYSDISEPRDKYGHLDNPNNGIHNQTLEAIANKKKCQHMLSKVLCSEKFILLCNLLCESFQGIEVDKVFDFSQINKKMKTGVYGYSPRLFNLDIQQMWKKLEKVGEEITHIASSLSSMSYDFSKQRVEEDATHEAGPQNFEDNHQTAAAVSANNFNDSPPDKIVPDLNHKEATPPIFSVCKQCGNKTTDDNERVLTCNECGTSYHFSCISEKETSTDSTWICAPCSNKNSQSLALTLHTNAQQTHGNCGVCERLDIPEDDNENRGQQQQQQLALLPPIKNCNNYSRDSSVSITDERESNGDEKQLASSTATLSHLCKQCGTCEDEDRRFIICGHSQCPYKYYHIRCLKSRQIASFQQQNRRCWYCPSCLCRACFQDRDDSLIVLCDGCDEAYHTYCMKPARSSVPKGRWYCLQCSMAKAKEGMRKYEEWILQQHVKRDDIGSGKGVVEDGGSLDVLLRAVDSMALEKED